MLWFTCWADWRHQVGVYSNIKWTWRSENYSSLAFRSLNDTLCKASMDQKSQMFLPTLTNNLKLRTFAPLSQRNVIQKVWLWILMYWVWLQKNEEYLTGTADCTTFGKLVSVLRQVGLGIAGVSNSDCVKRFSSWLYCCCCCVPLTHRARPITILTMECSGPSLTWAHWWWGCGCRSLWW